MGIAESKKLKDVKIFYYAIPIFMTEIYTYSVPTAMS